MLRMVGRWLRGICAGIGALVLVLLVLAAVARRTVATHVPHGTVLELDLDEPLAEWVPDDPLLRLVSGRRPGLRDVLDALEQARDDDRVSALVVRLGDARSGMAQLQELREAVTAFRAGGKPTVAFAESFGEFGPGNGPYYLASAFEEVWLQPSGDVGLTGILLETPFIRGTLEKLGVQPEFQRRKEYKTAVNLFTERGFTPAHREAAQALADGTFAQLVRGVAEGRHLAEADVRALCDRAPLSAEEAKAAGLVDGLGYRDEVWAHVASRTGGDADAPRWTLDRYLAAAGGPHDDGTRVALVHAVGQVHRGRSTVDPTSGDVSMGSDTVARALREAAEDDDVRAVVLRIDSPGGSYVASDVIWREVGRLRAAGKPVVATMGDVAASGGYFIAVAADRIVAQPGTITGSIGVLGGKMVTTDLWEKLGVTFDQVHEGTNATMWSSLHPYSDTEEARVTAALDRIYGDFTGKVAAGRTLAPEQVERIARGRVWTGEEAQRLGLVDVLGGYPAALGAVRELVGLPADAPLELVTFPPRRNLAQVVADRIAGREDGGDEPPVVSLRVAEAVRPLAALLGAPAPGVLGVDPAALPRP